MIQPQKRLLQNRQKPLKNIDGYTFITVFIFSKFWFLNSKLFLFLREIENNFMKYLIELVFFFFALSIDILDDASFFREVEKFQFIAQRAFWALKLF